MRIKEGLKILCPRAVAGRPSRNRLPQAREDLRRQEGRTSGQRRPSRSSRTSSTPCEEATEDFIQ
ncbi:MAG: hypothetical protein MZV70_54525 [Desulfobacterales bacterium]|nr:hypothetical protein [Desulfobacterales bacterium]